jgi:ribosomal protein S18 acetylase RimI-like enzyme
MIIPRPATVADADHLRAVARASGLFSPDEVSFLLEQFHADLAARSSAHWLIAPAGAAMIAPEPMSDNVWNLRFIAVLPGARRGGTARRLMSAAEEIARTAQGRLVLVDTASDDGTAAARAFYAAVGYECEAVIRDYHGDGIHRVTFRRRLASRAAALT